MTTYIAKARLRADAANRTVRSFLQALVAEVGIVVVPRLLDLVNDESVTWDVNVFRSLGRMALYAALAYIWRTVLDPSRIPSAQPPIDTTAEVRP